ncbi:type II toxin-antitoxin system PemK/MazF family toxin [Microcoleus sp. FACHB-53]|nr:type II toxin-antitoxin system PemK/MazF family toxin [Microcoleus sp. FACHB-53]
MSGQKPPRQGWIYYINPHRVVLRCKLSHTYIYDLPEPGEVECQHHSCQLKINSSRVFRGGHPHIVWTSKQFQDGSNYIDTFTLIPLTSSERNKGLPTTWPIKATSKNGLDEDSFALVHQICTVDANSFKDSNGDWLIRIGQLEKPDRGAIEERLKFFLGIHETPNEDWFVQNATPELLKKVYFNLSEDDQNRVLEELIDDMH